MSTNVKAKQPAAKSTGGMSQNQLMIIIGVIAVAAVALIALIAISGQSNAVAIDWASLNPQRTNDGGFIVGDPEAPVTIVEFADWGCPHCQDYHSTISRYIADYVATGKARFEFRMFPTAGGETTAFLGRIAQCADEAQPGSFWTAYDLYYELGATARYTNDAARTVAERLGLSYSDLLDCAEDANQVTIDVNVGRNIGVNGTPAVAIRYGDGNLQWITSGGTEFSRGAVDYNTLAAVTDAANGVTQ